MVDFYLSSTRNTKAIKRILGKALKGLKKRETPLTVNTDKASIYGRAIAALKKDGKLPDETLHGRSNASTTWLKTVMSS